MTMSSEERLAALEDLGDAIQIAWDGCHKMYFLTSPEQVGEARAHDYQVHPGEDLRGLIDQSCGLAFLTHWALGTDRTYAHLEIQQDDWDVDEEGNMARVSKVAS